VHFYNCVGSHVSNHILESRTCHVTVRVVDDVTLTATDDG